MRKYLRTEPITRQYKHVYTLEQFGLSRAQIMARSEEYLAWARATNGLASVPIMMPRFGAADQNGLCSSYARQFARFVRSSRLPLSDREWFGPTLARQS